VLLFDSSFNPCYGVGTIIGVLLADGRSQNLTWCVPSKWIAAPSGNNAVSIFGPAGNFELNVAQSYIRLRAFERDEIAEDAYVKCNDFGLTIISDDASSGGEVLSIDSDKQGVLVKVSRNNNTSEVRTSPFQGAGSLTFSKNAIDLICPA
jgi:hypothetical protein